MIDDPIHSIWDRLLHSSARVLPTELSSYILQLGLPDEDRERMLELGDKAQDGSLTPDERAELEAYSHASAFLSILHSKARSSLRSSVAVSGNGAPAA